MIFTTGCKPGVVFKIGCAVFRIRRAGHHAALRLLGREKFEISNLKSLAESCSRQIRAWADSLQNSDIKGQRHLTEKSRRQTDAQKRALETWQRINDSLPDGHPAKKSKI